MAVLFIPLPKLSTKNTNAVLFCFCQHVQIRTSNRYGSQHSPDKISYQMQALWLLLLFLWQNTIQLSVQSSMVLGRSFTFNWESTCCGMLVCHEVPTENVNKNHALYHSTLYWILDLLFCSTSGLEDLLAKFDN